MKNIFTEHPRSIGETYFQHFGTAAKIGLKMMIGGLACFLHAFFPFIFKNTGSDILLELTNEFIRRMPQLDERVAAIGKVIEQKKQRDA